MIDRHSLFLFATKGVATTKIVLREQALKITKHFSQAQPVFARDERRCDSENRSPRPFGNCELRIEKNRLLSDSRRTSLLAITSVTRFCSQRLPPRARTACACHREISRSESNPKTEKRFTSKTKALILKVSAFRNELLILKF